MTDLVKRQEAVQVRVALAERRQQEIRRLLEEVKARLDKLDAERAARA